MYEDRIGDALWALGMTAATIHHAIMWEKASGADKLLKPDLLDELSKSGVKYNPDDVIMVGKDSSGKLLWLEKGNDKAGLKHIINGHVEDFSAKGIEKIFLTFYTIL